MLRQAEDFGRWLAGNQSFPCPSMANRVTGKYNEIFEKCREALAEHDSGKTFENPDGC